MTQVECCLIVVGGEMIEQLAVDVVNIYLLEDVAGTHIYHIGSHSGRDTD